MQVLTLGAGTVGRWVSDILCRRGHSVTVVDADQENVAQINSELDVRAIVGSAARSTVLFQADVCAADVCLAVTGDDEVNTPQRCRCHKSRSTVHCCRGFEATDFRAGPCQGALWRNARTRGTHRQHTWPARRCTFFSRFCDLVQGSSLLSWVL